MSSFMETPRFPTNISKGVSFGPEFSTTVSTGFSGYEHRNKNRSRAVCKGDCAHAVKTPAQFKELLTYFRSVGGRYSGFRFSLLIAQILTLAFRNDKVLCTWFG